MKKLSDQQQREKNICISFIKDAKNELGDAHFFEFTRCEEEGKDPPDCWVMYKEMNVAIEIMELQDEKSKRSLKFCEAVTEELNKTENIPPIGISPKLEKVKGKQFLKESVKNIHDFITNNPYVLEDAFLMNKEFSKQYPKTSKIIFLQPINKQDKRIRFVKIMMSSHHDEQLKLFEKKIQEKVKAAKAVSHADRYILLLYLESSWKAGTHLTVDNEMLFACYRNILQNANKDKTIYRTYIYSDFPMDIYGHRKKVLFLA